MSCATIAPSDYLRDIMSARSNGFLAAMNASHTNYTNANMSNNSVDQSTKAAKMYDDWNDNEEYSSRGTLIKHRNNTPHVFHKRVGKWVATIKDFDYIHDFSSWVITNSPQSSSDRSDIYNKWKDLPRSQRIMNPYCYFNHSIPHITNNNRNSIIVKNINNHISEADLAFFFSYFGPIIDVYRPTYKKKEFIDNVNTITKKSFFIFIEFVSGVDTNHIIELFYNNSYYFNDTPIIVEKAGDPKCPPSPIAN